MIVPDGVGSPATELQAGELVPLNYAGSSSGAAQQVALVWMQAVAPCRRAALSAIRRMTLGSIARSTHLGFNRCGMEADRKSKNAANN